MTNYGSVSFVCVSADLQLQTLCSLIDIKITYRLRTGSSQKRCQGKSVIQFFEWAILYDSSDSIPILTQEQIFNENKLGDTKGNLRHLRESYKWMPSSSCHQLSHTTNLLQRPLIPRALLYLCWRKAIKAFQINCPIQLLFPPMGRPRIYYQVLALVLCSVLGSSGQQGHGVPGMGPAEGNKDA